MRLQRRLYGINLSVSAYSCKCELFSIFAKSLNKTIKNYIQGRRVNLTLILSYLKKDLVVFAVSSFVGNPVREIRCLTFLFNLKEKLVHESWCNVKWPPSYYLTTKPFLPCKRTIGFQDASILIVNIFSTQKLSGFYKKQFVEFQNLRTIEFCRLIFEILIKHKPSLGTCKVPQKIWARSVQPFWRLWVTNIQLPKQSMYIVYWCWAVYFMLNTLLNIKIHTQWELNHHTGKLNKKVRFCLVELYCIYL